MRLVLHVERAYNLQEIWASNLASMESRNTSFQPYNPKT